MQGREVPNINSFEKSDGDSFDTILDRAIRSEADVIYLDPIRDAETAASVLKRQSELCFIAEFPASDALGGIVQFAKLVGNAKAAEGLRAVISQRLLRLLCTQCKLAYRPNPKMLAKIGLPPETKTLYRAATAPPEKPAEGAEPVEPCEACGGSGYFGRSAIFELAEMTEGLRKLVAAGANLPELKAQARKDNMITFQHEGLKLVVAGQDLSGRAAAHLPAQEISAEKDLAGRGPGCSRHPSRAIKADRPAGSI